MPETPTESTTPHGAALLAFEVSSAMCADPSNPVYVHCACNSPRKNSHRYGACTDGCGDGVNRNETGCRGAKKKTAATIAITPKICTVTLTSFSHATSFTPY